MDRGEKESGQDVGRCWVREEMFVDDYSIFKRHEEDMKHELFDARRPTLVTLSDFGGASSNTRRTLV